MTGTVVKRKRGKLLADLARPGDKILVVRGGQGGVIYIFFFPLKIILESTILL